MKKLLLVVLGVLAVLVVGEIVFFKGYIKNVEASRKPKTSYVNLERPKDNNDGNDIVANGEEEVNLMIVAHPDDETLWGGAHLLKEKYYVVCVTCGTVSYRDEEFRKVMEQTDDDYLFLGYPDVVNGYISRWTNEKEAIVNDLTNIINSKNWKSIVTHNPEGEYGHYHHKIVSSIVSEAAQKDKLYYFGKYYASDVPDMKRLDEDIYNRKINDLISIYKSQPKAVSRHYHMLSYENFVQYYDWGA